MAELMSADWFSGISSGLSSFVVKVGVVIVLMACVGGMTWWYLNRRKWQQFRVIIYFKDGFGQWRRKYDQGAVFEDEKTNNRLLFLRKNHVGLTANNVPYIQDENNNKIVYLLQTGQKNFKYIHIDINDEHFKFTFGEEDLNWGLNAYEKQKKLGQQSLFMQLLPFIVMAFFGIMILAMVIFVLKDFKVLQVASENLVEAARVLSAGKANATIVTQMG
jgi:hypothetical protein